MNLLENLTKTFSVPLIELKLDAHKLKRATLPIYDLESEQQFPSIETEIAFYDDEQIKGEVIITPEDSSDFSYHSVEIHLKGTLQTLDQCRTFYDVSHVVDGASTIYAPKVLKFKFGRSEKPYETFFGRLFQVRYFLEVSVIRNGIARQAGEYFNIFIFHKLPKTDFKIELFNPSLINTHIKNALTFSSNSSKIEKFDSSENSDSSNFEENSENLRNRFFRENDKIFSPTQNPFYAHVPYLPIDKGLISNESKLNNEIVNYSPETQIREQTEKGSKMFIKNELYLEVTLNKSCYVISEPVFGKLDFKCISIPFSKVEVAIARKEWLGLSEEWLITILTKREIVEGVPFPGDVIPFRIDTRPIRHLLTTSYDIMRGEAAVFYCLQIFLCDKNSRKLFKEYMLEFRDNSTRLRYVK